MVIGNDREEILADIDRLKIGYQIKLYSAGKEDWQPYFHELSLDSHKNNQLFLDHNQLFFDHKPSIVLSGLALGKENQIKEINLVGDNCCFSGKLGCPSPALRERQPDIKNSGKARWKCIINFADNEAKEKFDLVITLDNNQKITYKKIDFYLVKLSENIQEINRKINHKLIGKIDSICLSRRLMATSILQDKNYLFVIGNARSGTTALVTLLNSSPEICLGIERYPSNDDISASSFEKDSFFNTEDKNYLVRPHFYEEIKDKFKKSRYIGDKRPGFVKSWKNTWLNLPQAKIIYIFRNIYDVACSYNIRASNAALEIDKSWPTDRDFSKAVRDWNKGLQEIKKLANFYEVYFIKYEDFFIEQSQMRHLFDYLKVTTKDQNVTTVMSRIHKTALSLQNKQRTLSDSEIKYIDSHADFEAYNDVLAFYEN